MFLGAVTLPEGSAVPVRRPRRIPTHVVDDEARAHLSAQSSTIRKQMEAVALPADFVRRIQEQASSLEKAFLASNRQTESIRRQSELFERLGREMNPQLEPMRQQLESMRQIGRQLERQAEAARAVTRALDSSAVGLRAALRAARVPVCSWRRSSRRPPPRARARRGRSRRVGGRRAARCPREPEPEPDDLSRARRGWSL